jgi:diguanylate cyclase (GGDEF)-like protein
MVLRSNAYGAGPRRVEGAITPELYLELVRALYGTPRSIFMAALVACVMLGVAFGVSGDPVFAWGTIGFLLVGFARCAWLAAFRRAPPSVEDHAAVRAWERRALIGAGGFASLCGVSGAYAVLAHTASPTAILICCCVIGYIAGISSRNASRPLITIAQISATGVPFIGALLAVGDVVHATIAGFLSVLFLSTLVMVRGAFENVAARHAAKIEMERLALFDTLTGLSSRAGFARALQARPDEPFIVLAVDLDGFKAANDTFGHAVGDAVLREAGRRLREIASLDAVVARVGGDEFQLAAFDLDDAGATALADRVVAALSAPIDVGEATIELSASVGAALFPAHGASVEEVIRNADLALTQAKDRPGRGRRVAYTPEISRASAERIALERDLRAAVDAGALSLAYQPIVDARTGRAIACEALLRWTHTVRGPISPAVFVPIAEVTGIIDRMGAWVMETAAREALAWPSDVAVSVNLSPVQFRDGKDIVGVVAGVLARTGLEPRRLHIEITESVIIEDTPKALATLEALRALGVCLSLDDFGTGYSSLAYLSDFPFSKLKVDRHFARSADGSERSAAVVRGIVEISKRLGIEVIAEGVETVSQLETLHGLGVNAIQGFLFSKPVPVPVLRELLTGPIRPEVVIRPGRERAAPGMAA